MKQDAGPGEQSEAPRRWWKLGQQQPPGPENQDSQHMLNQPRGSFPEFGRFQSEMPTKTSLEDRNLLKLRGLNS